MCFTPIIFMKILTTPLIYSFIYIFRVVLRTVSCSKVIYKSNIMTIMTKNLIIIVESLEQVQ